MSEGLYALLNSAVSHGRKEEIYRLLDEGAPVNFAPVYEYRSPLHSSVYLGNPEVVQELVNRGASVNVLNYHGETALTLAAKYEKHSIVDILLSSKELKNSQNDDNLNHLHVACMRNKIDIVKKLIRERADINAVVKEKSLHWPGYTPLHFAVRFQCVEAVKYLLSLGVDITIKDARRDTPLHLADLLRSEHIIDLILEANLNVVSNPKNLQNVSHFHIACTRNNLEIVEFFFRIGVNLKDYAYGEHYNCDTALDLAMYYGCTDVVKFLLLHDDLVRSPVRFEVSRIENAYLLNDPEFIDLLCSRNELLHKKCAKIEKVSNLHYSCIHHDVDKIDELLSRMPYDLNSTLWNGCTPLHLLVESRNYETTKFLLHRGADFSIRNANGKSPLHLAFGYGLQSIVGLILSDLNWINQNPVDNDGISHLHIACTIDKPEVIRRFVELGSDLNSIVSTNSRFWAGFSPLHFAAKYKREKVVEILLSNGACYSSVDYSNQSAFDVLNMMIHNYSRSEDRYFTIMQAILSFHASHNHHPLNNRGYSLLHLLSITSDTEMSKIEEFVDSHPQDIDKVVNVPGHLYDGFTPLHLAMKFGNQNIAKLLLRRGASILRRAANGDMPLHLAFESGIYLEYPLKFKDSEILGVNPTGSTGYSLFHVACGMGDIELMKYFLGHGVDANSATVLKYRTFYDKTPLHLVSYHCPARGVEAVKLLIANGANVNARDSKMNTPLHLLRFTDTVEIIDVLVNHGADVNALNALHETPLLSVCIDGSGFPPEDLYKRMLSFLNNGADINLADEEGVTPLTNDFWARNHGWTGEPNAFLNIVDTLLRHVIKLETIGFYVSDANKKAYSMLLNHFEDDLDLDEAKYVGMCTKELELMKNTYTDKYTTLHDILLKSLNKLAVMSENNILKMIVNANDLHVKYPIYGHMLKLQLIKGQVRRPLLQKAQRSLKFLTGVALPEVCSENILSLITNEDLQNLINIQK